MIISNQIQSLTFYDLTNFDYKMEIKTLDSEFCYYIYYNLFLRIYDIPHFDYFKYIQFEIKVFNKTLIVIVPK